MSNNLPHRYRVFSKEETDRLVECWLAGWTAHRTAEQWAGTTAEQVYQAWRRLRGRGVITPRVKPRQVRRKNPEAVNYGPDYPPVATAAERAAMAAALKKVTRSLGPFAFRDSMVSRAERHGPWRGLPDNLSALTQSSSA